MRVIAGEAKGRRLVAVAGGGTRSATDMVREALFAILGARCEGAMVLDLFAGAGTLGIEALSRGAERGTFVERGTGALEALRRNLAATGLVDRATVIGGDVLASLDRVSGPFEIVFCDPPFGDRRVLERTLAHERLPVLIAAGGLLVTRALRKHPPALPAHARTARERIFGEQALYFLEYSAA